jgi:hypothetical protein
MAPTPIRSMTGLDDRTHTLQKTSARPFRLLAKLV